MNIQNSVPTVKAYVRKQPEIVHAYQFEEKTADGYEFICKDDKRKCTWYDDGACTSALSGNIHAQNCKSRVKQFYLYVGGISFASPHIGDYVEQLVGMEKRIWPKDEFEAMFQEIEDASDETPSEMEKQIVPAEKLPAGWNWVDYNDGSGHLASPTDKSYFSYDLSTHEFRHPGISGNNWRFFDGYPYDCISLIQFKEQAENWILANAIE